MPYTNLDQRLWPKMERCVQKVMAGGHSKESAIAICYTAISDHDISASELELLARDFDRNVGGGVDRDKLKDSDFVFGDERAFPVVTEGDVSDAVHSWGRYRGKHSFEQFKRNLTRLARRKGFEKELPKEWREQSSQSSVEWSTVNDEDLQAVHSLVGAVQANELMKFKNAVLCYAGSNLNGDGLDEQGLHELASTLSLMPLDDEHDEHKIIGFFINPRVENSVLYTDGIVYARRFPELTADIQSNRKKLSVEARGQLARCSVCGQEFQRPADYCEHLLGRPQNGAIRWLSGMRAVGGGATYSPAFPQAGFDANGFVMIASLGANVQEREDNEMERLEELEVTLAKIQSELESVQARNRELEASLAETERNLAASEQALKDEMTAHARGIELLSAGFSQDEVNKLHASLKSIDEAVLEILKSSKAASAQAGLGGVSGRVLGDQRPMDNRLAGSQDMFAIFDAFTTVGG